VKELGKPSNIYAFRISLAEPAPGKELQASLYMDVLGYMTMKQGFQPQWPLAEATQVGAAAALQS